MSGPPVYGQCPHCFGTLTASHVCPVPPDAEKPALKVVTLNASNYRQAAETLRVIAAEIDAGTYGEVGCAALVVLGDQMSVFGMGPDSSAPSVALLLHAGFSSLSRTVENHGKT